MQNTPRLKNLLKMRRALLSLSEAVSNLTDEDCENLNQFVIPFSLPNIVYLNKYADYTAEIIRSSVRKSQKAALPADQATLFCAICGDTAPHQRLVANGQSRYRCTKCGTVGGAL